MNILGISGSLRKDSFNSALLQNLVDLAPDDVSIASDVLIDKLPFFNPDIDNPEKPPEMVAVFRKLLRKADGIVLVSPEYAHNISGVLKNALDWLVASGELVHKPVVVINVSTSYVGGEKAHTSLKYLVNLLSAHLLEEASFHISSATQKFDDSGKLTDEETIGKLKSVYVHFKKYFEMIKTSNPG